MHEDYGYPDPAEITPEMQKALDEGMAMGFGEPDAADREFARIISWKLLREKWHGVTWNLKAAGRSLREVRQVWPGFWFVVKGFIPRRVWWTWGPPGHGPSGETPVEAAAFIANDSGMAAEENPGEGLVKVEFTPGELRRLWWPGATLERNGWGIKCKLIPSWAWGQFEWDGY